MIPSLSQPLTASDNECKRSIPLEKLQQGIAYAASKIDRIYEISIHNMENILPGKAVYALNHHHHFDPMFFIYALAKAKGILSHHMVKPSLYRIPVAGKYLKRFKTICTPRQRMGEELTWEDYERMKQEVAAYLAMDEPVSFSYTGTITRNVRLTERDLQLEKETAAPNTGMISLVKHDKDLHIVPVAIDTFQTRKDWDLVNSLLFLSGWIKKKNKIPVEISFGKPIHISSFLKTKGNKKSHLMDKVVEEVFSMRSLRQNEHGEDRTRSIDRYFSK